MTLTTVTGRVRATQRLKAGATGAHVVATSWSSDRTFPRTAGVALAFDLEAGDGAVYRVDPFEAVVTLPVRQTAERAGVRHEEAWIAVADEITVEGELEPPARGRALPELRARRIGATTVGGAALHRLPPRSLQRGEGETIEAPVEGAEAPAAEATAAEAPAPAARRPKKKRPDPTGTPPPIQ